MDRNDKKFLDASDWDQTQTGFNFDENEVVGGFSITTRKNEDYQLLRCDGLIEASENRPLGNITSQLTWLEEDKNLHIVEKKYNPLEFSLKQEKDITKLTASQTIKHMILGRSYSLESFKSRESKSELLKTAVSSHDGNAILAVVLFLKSTLKKSIFHREIRMYSDAVRVYLSFLEEDHEMDELANMFLLLDNADEAAMTKYKSALSLHHPDRKLKNINNCLSTHFQAGVVDDFLCASVVEHKQLLRDQIALDEYHAAAASSSEVDTFNSYRQLTSEMKLVDTSVMCSLIFQTLFYFSASEAAFISPGYTKAIYNLSRKQYTWGAVRAFIASKKWTEMDALFISKNWLGNEKVKSCISFPQIIRALVKMPATHKLISKYVNFIENQELKLLLAKKYKCHSVVIEILKTNRDRLGLLEYKSTLPPHSVDFCCAADILNNKAIKWRN